MRTIFAVCFVALSVCVGCDVGQYLTLMELLSNDTIVQGVISICQSLIAGAIN